MTDRERVIKFFVYCIKNNSDCLGAPDGVYIACGVCPLHVSGSSMMNIVACVKNNQCRAKWLKDNVSAEELMELLL